MNGVGRDRITLIGASVRATLGEPVALVCPRCGVDRDGRLLERQRWGHVLGLRIVPLAKLKPMIECNGCGYQAGLCVLEIPTTAVLSQRLEAAMRSATATVVRAGCGEDVPDAELTDEVVRTMTAAGYEYTPDDLVHDLATTDETQTSSLLRLLADDLTPHGKQGLLHRMIAIAVADGPLTTAERRALERMGVSLAMAPPHIIGVLGTATQVAESAA